MYFPYQKGRYEVAPGLLPITQDFGNGAWDQRLFQIGDDFAVYRKQFEENRAKEAISKYVCLAESADVGAVGAISEFIFKQLANEYSGKIHLSSGEFANEFTGETLEFNANTNGINTLQGAHIYESAWDAAGAQVPEDIAIWKLNADGSEEIEAIHLNAPNHWAAGDKVGRSFAAVHHPVPHIEKIVPWAVNLLKGILQKGPYVRFAWGVSTDDRLNHHPIPPSDTALADWMGRRFDSEHPKLFARVERQVVWGFPELNRVLFTIRTYFQDVEVLKKTHP